MTYNEACEILVKHNQFFELYAQQKYVPRAMESVMAEIESAYNVINPDFKNTCSKCGAEIIIDSNRHRLKYIKYLAEKHPKPKFYKFD
jgi:hypothetical protein